MENETTSEDLTALIARFEARERELEERIVRLEQQLATVPAAPVGFPTEGAPTPPPTPQVVAGDGDTEGDELESASATDRRQLFKKAGVMAAGTLAAGTVLAVSQANPAAAATVTGSGNPGVRGTSAGGNGVEGETSAVGDSGVYGLATGASAHGVYAKSMLGNALIAESQGPTGDGINTIGPRYGIVATGTLAPLVLVGSGVVPPPIQAKTHFQGEIIMDVNEDFWACVAGGNPGTFRRLTGPQDAGSLRVLATTTRIYDSRPGTQPPTGNKGKFTDHQQKTIDASDAVPSGATAVMINATATNTNPGGYFAFFVGSWPNNSSLSWGTANNTVAVTTVVKLSASRTFVARCEGAGGADLIVDVIGFYR